MKQSKIKVKKERKKVTTTQTQDNSGEGEEGNRRTIRASPPNLGPLNMSPVDSASPGSEISPHL